MVNMAWAENSETTSTRRTLQTLLCFCPGGPTSAQDDMDSWKGQSNLPYRDSPEMKNICVYGDPLD